MSFEPRISAFQASRTMPSTRSGPSPIELVARVGGQDLSGQVAARHPHAGRADVRDQEDTGSDGEPVARSRSPASAVAFVVRLQQPVLEQLSPPGR